MKQTPSILLVFFLLAAGLSPASLRASPVTFLVASNQSSITLSGTVEGYSITAQGTGSLTALLNGTINANVTGSTIQFTGGNAITPITNGIWQPAVGGSAGSAPADYGAKASPGFGLIAYAALRNLVLNLNSATLAVSGGSFDSAALTFGLTNSSSMDYTVPLLGSGTESLSGLSTNSVTDGATLASNGSSQTLTIHLSTTYTSTGSVPAVLTLAGQIVAITEPAPVIGSLAISNQSLVITVANATGNSVLLTTPSLTSAWTAANPTTSTNGSGQTVYTVPVGTGNAFFRVQQ